jgi:hypothetical protein
MKKFILLLFLLPFLQRSHAQAKDTAAARIIEARLKVISDYLDKKETNLQKISDAVYFLTQVSGVASELEGSYYGQYHPTAADLKAWTGWYKHSGEYLFWDKEAGAVVLYRKAKVEE